MAFPEPRAVASNGIEMAVHEQGAGAPVVLLHGFPELAYSWRHQLPALAAAGYRAIAPDLRGYGGTSKPAAVDAYAMRELIDDVLGLLDALQIDRATIVGHDWGALLAWQMALLVPDRMESVVALNVPFIPRPPIDPIDLMRAALGEDFYIVNFQDSNEADRRCAADPARVFEVMMRRNVITRTQFEQLPQRLRSYSLLAALNRTELPGEYLLSAEETRVYVDAFTAGGFTGPINWYRNMSRNWAATADVEQRVTIPAFFIEARNDIIISLQQIETMRDYVENLHSTMIEDCGHWTQQERPAELNQLLLDWLARG